MKKTEFLKRIQDLESLIEDLKAEFIKESPFKIGDKYEVDGKIFRIEQIKVSDSGNLFFYGYYIKKNGEPYSYMSEVWECQIEKGVKNQLKKYYEISH